MEIKEIYKKIEDTFFARVEEKTSWGKEELKKLWMKTKADVMEEALGGKSVESLRK